MEELPTFSQDNILTLLCFNEGAAFLLVRNAVTVDLFTDIQNRVIAEKVLGYIDLYGKPPGDHVAHLLDDELNGPGGKELQSYLYELFERRQYVNEQFTIDKLRQFVSKHRLLKDLVAASNFANSDDIEGARQVLLRSSQAELTLFEPGLHLKDYAKGFEESDAEDPFMTGIEEFDKRGLGPAVGQFFLFAAPPKGGKSWMNVHLGARAAGLGKKVCHITLELTEKQTFKRYVQNLLSVSQRHIDGVTAKIAEFSKNDRGYLTDIIQRDNVRPSFEDSEFFETLKPKWDALGPRLTRNVYIKGFPTGGLSVSDLRVYLQALERLENFIPDIVVLDHADYMNMPGQYKEYRLNLQEMYIKLRGLAIERHFALTSASQLNREGTSTAESYGKIGIVDTVVMYQQTAFERAMNVARLVVTNSRVGEDKFSVLVSQNYKIGQFCLADALIPKGYDPSVRFTPPALNAT